MEVKTGEVKREKPTMTKKKKQEDEINMPSNIHCHRDTEETPQQDDNAANEDQVNVPSHFFFQRDTDKTPQRDVDTSQLLLILSNDVELNPGPAMRLLYDLRKQMDAKTGSPFELWIKKNGWRTIEKFQCMKEENSFTGPVPFMQESENTKFKVTIDPGQQFNIVDKLSQVNCIQQLENIAAFPFLKERLSQNDLLLHAFWYDIHSGNVFLLSRERQRFVEVNERSYFSLMQEVKNRASAKILSDS